MPTPARPRFVPRLVLALVAIAFSLLAAPSSHAAAPATVAGRVTDSAGAGVRLARVEAVAGDEILATTGTGAGGAYVLKGLVPGTYRVRVTDPWRDYATTWFGPSGTATDAEVLEVNEGETRSGVDVSVGKFTDEVGPAAVTGSLRDGTGQPRRGARVWASRLSESGGWAITGSVRVRQDGYFGFPPGALPAGEYRFEARADGWLGNPGIVPELFGDGRSYVVDPATPLDLGSLEVTRKGTITGVVTVPPVAGYPEARAAVRVGGVGEYIPDAQGRYELEVAPGSYTVSFSGRRVSPSWAELEFFDQSWKGAGPHQAPTPVVVGEGQAVTGISATLSRRIVAYEAPRITGPAVVGYRLSSDGAWWNLHGATVDQRWVVDGRTVGRGQHYIVRAADRGKRVSVVVRATDPRYDEGSATATSVVVKTTPYVGLNAFHGRRSSRVQVSLSLPGRATRSTSGVVRIYEGSRRLATLRIVKGRAERTLRLRRGTHRLRAVYAGSREYLPAASPTRRVRIR